MILNEAPWPPPDGSGLPEWWDDPDNAEAVRNDPRNRAWSTHNPEGRKFWKEKVRVRVPAGRPWRKNNNIPERVRREWEETRREAERWRNPPKPKPGPKPATKPQTAAPTRNPTATRTPAPKPGARPIRGLRPALGAAGGLLTLINLYSIYQDLFGDDGVEVDVIPDDGQVIKPVNPQPKLELEPLHVPPHLRDPRNYPGQHPVRPPKSPAGGSQGSGGGSGGGIGGGGGMGM